MKNPSLTGALCKSGEQFIESHRGSPSLPGLPGSLWTWFQPAGPCPAQRLAQGCAGEEQVPEAWQGVVGERKRQLTELLTEAKFNGKSSSFLYYTLVSQTKKICR